MTQSTANEVTIGIDLGDQHSHFCALDSAGEILEGGRLKTTKEAFERRFTTAAPMRIAIEASTHSPRVSALLEEARHDVIVANVLARGRTDDRPVVAERIKYADDYQASFVGPGYRMVFRAREGALEVYDTERDPAEQVDLGAFAASYTERSNAFRAELERLGYTEAEGEDEEGPVGGHGGSPLERFPGR